MNRSEMLSFALSSSSRNHVVTDEVKEAIEKCLTEGKKCNEIFKELVKRFPNLKYQNVRSYLNREALKAAKS